MKLSVKLLTTFSLLLLSVLLTRCKKDESKPIPAIDSFSPISAFPGEQVTIIGSNFSADLSSDIVKFNGTEAVVNSVSTTQIIATVPSGSTTGKISVIVGGQTGNSVSDFTVRATPTIASFTPGSGVVGTTVTITGTNFGATPSDNIVKFNGVVAPVINASSTSLTVTVPAQTATGKITITAGPMIVTSGVDFIVPLPTITSFSPTHALPGTMVIITGTNFVNGSLSLNKVKVNNTDATVTAATGTQLTVTVPNSSTGPIVVDVSGQTVSSANNFEVLIDIPRNGLVAFYPFTGNANDVSGNNLNGTLGGTVSAQIPVSTADRFGKAGQAYDFDGVDDLIAMGNPPLLQIANNLTFSGWFNVRAVKPNNYIMGMVSKSFHDNNNQFNGGYTIYEQAGAGGFVEWGHSAVYGQPGGYYLQSTTPATTGTWIFIAVVFNGTSIKFYKNGVLVNSAAGTTNTLDDGTKGELFIGTYGNYSSTYFNFNGFIDDIAIYNRGLTDSEITQLYQQTVTKY